MKRIQILLTATLISFYASAQSLSPQVIASAGGYASSGGVSLSWTLGETFTTTLQNGNNILTQGFQQPFIELRILNLKAFLQGYYIGSGAMQPVLANQFVAGATGLESDTIYVELHDAMNPSTLIASTTALLMTDGSAVASFKANAGSYYVAIKHRNTIQTWSAAPVALPSTYDFTTSADQAFFGNMIDVYGENIWSFYTGDLNQDDFIDIFDFPAYDFDNQNFVAFAYANTDMNGDGFVDIFDFPIFDFNNQNFVFAMYP